MKTGVWLHDHFYRKHCGKPMYGLEEKGWFFLNMDVVRKTTPKIFKELEKLEVECIEIGGLLSRVEKMEPVLTQRGKIELILHTSGDPSPENLVSSNSHIMTASLENIKRNIDFARQVNADKLVLHPPSFSKTSLEIMKDIVKYAELKSIIICIENCKYGKEGIEEILKYGEKIRSRNLYFTFDTGHCNIGFSPEEGAKMLGEKIMHIHWHDNNGKKDEHLCPGMGNINFSSLFNVIFKIEKEKKEDITITLECDKPEVDYEEAFEELKRIKFSYFKKGKNGKISS